MCREIRAKKNFKFYKKGYMAIELTESLLEIAPGVRGEDTFLWDQKEVVYFSAEEKMQMISFIIKPFTDGEKMEPLYHMESASPKTIFIEKQIYNNKKTNKNEKQIKISVCPKEGKTLMMSLGWGQVIGFKMWLEECLRNDIKGRREDLRESYVYLSGVEDKPIKATRHLPKELNVGDLYMWNEVTRTICTGRLYDSYSNTWTICFEFDKSLKPKEKKKFNNRLATARGNAQ